jgi:ketosteroid isomerase-like protein
MAKNIHLAVSLVVIMITLSACENSATNTSTNTATNSSSTASNSPAAGKDPKIVEDVKATLAKHDKALNDKNLDALMATYSTDADTVLLGTGAGERFVGQQAIKEAYTEMLKDYDAGTLNTNCEWKSGGVDDAGTTAWLAATCKAEDSLKNVKRDYVLNVSGALEKQNGEWKFVMLHMSNATNATPPSGPPVVSDAKPAPSAAAPAK